MSDADMIKFAREAHAVEARELQAKAAKDIEERRKQTADNIDQFVSTASVLSVAFVGISLALTGFLFLCDGVEKSGLSKPDMGEERLTFNQTFRRTLINAGSKLYPCIDCERTISTKTSTCPHCGGRQFDIFGRVL